MDAGQLFDRDVKQNQSGQKANQIRHRPVRGEDVNDQHSQPEHRQHLDDGVDQFLGLNAFHAVVDQFTRRFAEARQLEFLQAKRFHDTNAGDQFHQLAGLRNVCI